MAEGKSSVKKALRIREFSVDTRPTKHMVVESLTRDISLKAAVFDLIDNSIDAARDTIFAQGDAETTDVLPESYKGFKIALSVSSDGCSIEDNCGGIGVESLKAMVLRFGQRSSHPMGIGIFGLGLNRALFKLGRVSHLKTDTGAQRAELVLNVDDYLKSEDWNLPAEEFKSSGKAGTSIEITQLADEAGNSFGDSDWVDSYCADIGRRYARFLEKGLQIRVNKVLIADGEVRIRPDGPFPEEYKFYRKDGVTIHIRVGQHSEHRFTAEPDYDKDRNAPLTPEFGWTVVCNDRAIVVSDQTWKTGWEAKFHAEFYGFVGMVSFDSKDPGKLPWDTTKFDVDMNNPAYQAALVDMRKFAAKWRSYARRVKIMQRKGEKLLPLPDGTAAEKATQPARTKAAQKSQTAKVKKLPTVKPDHNQFSTVLPDDVDEVNCFDKHLALVHEAKGLHLSSHTYSGMALIRCLFEASVVTHLERVGKLAELKQFAIDERKKKNLTIKSEKDVAPDIDEMIAFLENHPDTWGAIKQNHVRHSLRRMASHKKLLNSAVHNPWQPINKSEAFVIRDEVLPILRHLIET